MPDVLLVRDNKRDFTFRLQERPRLTGRDVVHLDSPQSGESDPKNAGAGHFYSRRAHGASELPRDDEPIAFGIASRQIPNPTGPGASAGAIAPTPPSVATPSVPDKPDPNRCVSQKSPTCAIGRGEKSPHLWSSPDFRRRTRTGDNRRRKARHATCVSRTSPKRYDRTLPRKSGEGQGGGSLAGTYRTG